MENEKMKSREEQYFLGQMYLPLRVGLVILIIIILLLNQNAIFEIDILKTIKYESFSKLFKSDFFK